MFPYLQRAVLVARDLMVAVAIAVQRREHDAERTSPLAEEDEQVVPQRLLGEQEASVVDYRDRGRGKERERLKE